MASKDKNAKKKNASASGGFVIAVILAIVVLGGGVKCEPSDDFKRIPNNEPTDVGTLPPGLDK